MVKRPPIRKTARASRVCATIPPLQRRQIRADVRLTEREVEILLCVAEDLSSKEAGARLDLDQKTIEFHRQNIRRKLGVSGTAGMVRYAIRAGLLQP